MSPLPLIVRILLWRGRREIILIKDPTKNLPLLWSLPGGNVEVDEMPQDAAARELREETGIVIPPRYLVPLSVVDIPGKSRQMFYKGRIQRNRPVPVRGETGEIVRVFSIEEVKKLVEGGEMHPIHAEFLKKLDALA